VRERRPGEVPFEETSRYLWESPDGNNVPGPDSLLARVRIDAQLHPHVEIEDLKTKRIIPLLEASLPQWSPDGAYLSCIVWKSPGQPHELAVVDVTTRTIVLDPEIRASAGRMKWAPDGGAIAVAGVIYGRPRTMLYVVSVPDGATTPLDTLSVLGDYEFSWSPDGRWIAFSHATKLDHHQEYAVAADLWIADARSGKKWPILETPEWVELNPLWITNQSIQVDRARSDGTQLGTQQRVVVELSTPKEGTGRSP
jgi:dipeptidyl aminopeptidase/acylaminoacyl peptidase